MGIDGVTLFGVGLIVGGLGLLATATVGLGRRYGLFDRRRKRRPRKAAPVRPQGTDRRTERPEAVRDPGRGNANPGRTNPRPGTGEPRPRTNERARASERPRPIVDPRRMPPVQPARLRAQGNQAPSTIRSSTGSPGRPSAREAMDTLQLHPVPAWSQPAGGPYREPPRNDPPRGDLVAPVRDPADGPSPVGRPVLITEMVSERVIETVIVETRPRGGA